MMSSSAHALPRHPGERAELFATCSGRLEALATRQKARSEDRAAESDRLRAEFDTLLEAILPIALTEGLPARQARRWRDRGWIEIATLLADAEYSSDDKRAELAWQDMNRRISHCREVLL